MKGVSFHFSPPICMQITSAKDYSLSEITVHSIGISNAPTTFLLRCFHCGREQSQVQGKLTRIIPWYEPTTTLTVINKCARCLTRYTIQETQSNATVLVRLGITELSPFHCAVCSHDIHSLSTSQCPICKTIYDFRNEMV